jgi:hypothetical protein
MIAAVVIVLLLVDSARPDTIMKRTNAGYDFVVPDTREVDLTDLEVALAGSQSKVGTLSSPCAASPTANRSPTTLT